jgi:hypothetical protein
MMYWLTDIILKDLKLGFAEATVLDALHPVPSVPDPIPSFVSSASTQGHRCASRSPVWIVVTCGHLCALARG